MIATSPSDRRNRPVRRAEAMQRGSDPLVLRERQEREHGRQRRDEAPHRMHARPDVIGGPPVGRGARRTSTDVADKHLHVVPDPITDAVHEIFLGLHRSRYNASAEVGP